MDQILNDMQIKVTRINSDVAKKIIDNPNAEEHIGRFFLIEDDKTITCIDNTNGDAFTECFTSIVAAAYWILGKYELGDLI